MNFQRYLNKIEDSLDTSKAIQLRKKIAGRFSTEVAYGILTQVQFKTNHDNSFITALVPNRLDLGGMRAECLGKRKQAGLSERHIATISEQLESVYGINGYYVQEVEEDEIQPPKSRTSDIAMTGKSIGILEQGKSSQANAEAIIENTLWHQIRKGLREEPGEAIDTVWFSKAAATECKDTKTLTITMPTRFMSDFIRNNYSHVIRRLTSNTGIKMVEYGF